MSVQQRSQGDCLDLLRCSWSPSHRSARCEIGAQTATKATFLGHQAAADRNGAFMNDVGPPLVKGLERLTEIFIKSNARKETLKQLLKHSEEALRLMNLAKEQAEKHQNAISRELEILTADKSRKDEQLNSKRSKLEVAKRLNEGKKDKLREMRNELETVRKRCKDFESDYKSKVRGVEEAEESQERNLWWFLAGPIAGLIAYGVTEANCNDAKQKSEAAYGMLRDHERKVENAETNFHDAEEDLNKQIEEYDHLKSECETLEMTIRNLSCELKKIAEQNEIIKQTTHKVSTFHGILKTMNPKQCYSFDTLAGPLDSVISFLKKQRKNELIHSVLPQRLVTAMNEHEAAAVAGADKGQLEWY